MTSPDEYIHDFFSSYILIKTFFLYRYFSNQVLTKEYTLQFGFTNAKDFKSSLRNSTDFAHYDGVPKIVDCKGCKVSHSFW